jgi:hypothetical protein
MMAKGTGVAISKWFNPVDMSDHVKGVRVEFTEGKFPSWDSPLMEYVSSRPQYSIVADTSGNYDTSDTGGIGDLYVDLSRAQMLDGGTWLYPDRDSTKWLCDYCGRRNKRKRETCRSCGAVGG